MDMNLFQNRGLPGGFWLRLSAAGLSAGVVLALGAGAAAAAVVDSGSLSGWTAVLYSSTLPDPKQDQQTGQQEADLVGDATHGALLTRFDDGGTSLLTDGVIYYRLRLGGQENPPGYSRAAFVGIDVDRDGDIDGFIGVDNSGSSDQVAIWDAGIGANISPSTTSIASVPYASYALGAANYNWRAVAVGTDGGTTNDLDGGTSGTDFYLSFAVPFADVVSYFRTVKGKTIDQNSDFRYVFATATQANSLNQDIGAIAGGVNSSTTWTSLGAISNAYSASGSPVPVPEPAPALLACLLAGAAGLRRRR